MVPEGWKIKALSDIAAVERGKFSVRPRNDPQYYGGTIPFIQTGDVATSDGRITSYSQTLNERGLAVSRLFPKGTIFITIAANIGNAAIAEFDTACPDSIVAVQPTDDTSIIWLLHVLLLEQPKLDAYASQNAQKNINLETLRPLPILTPPNEEQHRIAAILSTWDTAITQMEKLCEAKRKLKKGLMQQCLTGKRRFPEFGTARQRTQWHFYDYPSEWAHPQLKEIASEVTVRNASGTVRTVLSCSKYVGFINSPSISESKSIATTFLITKSFSEANLPILPITSRKVQLDCWITSTAGLLARYTLYLEPIRIRFLLHICMHFSRRKLIDTYLRWLRMPQLIEEGACAGKNSPRYVSHYRLLMSRGELRLYWTRLTGKSKPYYAS